MTTYRKSTGVVEDHELRDHIPTPRELDGEGDAPFPQADAPLPRRKPWEFLGRHVTMMALGTPGAQVYVLIEALPIGTGVLYESGGYLPDSGNVTLLLAYLLTGTVMYAVTVAFPAIINRRSNEIRRLWAK
jgi:hypothetical protein